jgi:glucose-1-phosphate adenylyltransferase
MKTRAVILAGGEGNRLGVLTAKRAKPAVPFAGKYRLIDFPLSNCVNSGIFDVMILTQYRPHSLNEHIGAGHPWDLDRSFTGGVQIYQPYKGRTDTDWYAGTADAFFQNLGFLKRGNPDMILVLGGDHIYEMNYDYMVSFHLEHQADVTIATRRVPREEATRMGILSTDTSHRVTQFVEKPKDPPSLLASMGIYIFSYPILEKMLREDALHPESQHDFGKNIIPGMMRAGMRVFAYPFDGYWMDVGTVDSYWSAHMDLLSFPPAFNLYDRSWIIHTRSEERPPVKIKDSALVKDSMLTDGTIVAADAVVERSVLSPGVYVGPGAVVRESIILTDASIEAGARVERAIIDKLVTVGHNAQVGRLDPEATDLGITAIGKNVKIPNGLKIGRNVTVEPDVEPEAFPPQGLADGEILRAPKAQRGDV